MNAPVFNFLLRRENVLLLFTVFLFGGSWTCEDSVSWTRKDPVAFLGVLGDAKDASISTWFPL